MQAYPVVGPDRQADLILVSVFSFGAFNLQLQQCSGPRGLCKSFTLCHPCLNGKIRLSKKDKQLLDSFKCNVSHSLVWTPSRLRMAKSLVIELPRGACMKCSWVVFFHRGSHIRKTTAALAPSDVLVGNFSDEVKDDLKGINYSWRKFLVGRLIVGSQWGGIHTAIVPLCYGGGRNPCFSCQLLSELEDSESSRGRLIQVYFVLK